MAAFCGPVATSGTKAATQSAIFLPLAGATRRALATPIYKTVSSPPPTVVTGALVSLDAVSFTSGASSWPALIGNTWTTNGTITKAATSGGSSALVFTGAQYVMDQTGIQNSTMASHTIDIWIYPAQNGVVMSEMGQSGAPSTVYHAARINLVSGSIRVGFWAGSIYSFSLGSYTANNWVNITYSYSGGSLVGYVNGVQIATGSSTWSSPTVLGNGTASYFAVAAADATNFGNGSAFVGHVGAVKIYGSALNATQVKQNYNALCGRYGLPSI
jgi:hypothetical protein